MRRAFWRAVHLLPDWIVRKVCDMCAEIPDNWDDVFGTAKRRIAAGPSGLVDATTALTYTKPDQIVGYGCEHMNITASGIVAGSVKAPCGCAMVPVLR